MAVIEAGVSTLGVKVGYALGGESVPSSGTVKWLERCNSIGSISLDTQTIDASALEDEITKTVAGRQDTGSTWAITWNMTDEVVTILETMISEYSSKSESQQMWLEVWSPNHTKAFWCAVQPPLHIPMPEFSQNALETIELQFAIVNYAGMADGIEPTSTVSGS